MNSFDVWDTLIARRRIADARIRYGLPVPGSEPQRVLELELEQCFPILENVAKVRPGDLLLSDYDLPTILEPLVRQVTGLQNKVVVTEDGKYNDWVWPKVMPIAEHTGDSARSDGTCERHGIKFNHVIQTRHSGAEITIGDYFGMRGLAQLMREVRLSTYSPNETTRQLQLVQSQVNLPMLFAASVLLHRMAGQAQRILMSSRDCWLWLQLFEQLKPMLGGAYELVYFYTSRLMRYWPSETYKEYVRRATSVPALIVDLCGFGTSLRHQFGDTVPLLLLIGYKDCKTPCMVEGWLDEVSNFARHPMVGDVDNQGRPVYVNPLDINWTGVPELTTMHSTFMSAVRVAHKHDFTNDFKVTDATLRNVIQWALSCFSIYNMALGTLRDFRVSEAVATEQLINSKGVLPPGSVVA